jgi:hypothetical protein
VVELQQVLRRRRLGLSRSEMKQSVANVRRVLEEVGVSTDDLLDVVIEGLLIASHEIRSRPHTKEEQELYGYPPNETTEDEKHAALG